MHKPVVNETLELARELGIRVEAIAALEACLTEELLQEHEADCLGMTQYDQAEVAWQRISEQYKDADPDGLIVLGLCLASACRTREHYRRYGFPDLVFLETMACFTRFTEEDYRQAGKACFTRGFWVWRQLSCRLFRLGILEFEYRGSRDFGEKLLEHTGGKMILSVHIPSDARMADELLRESYAEGLAFFREHEALLCPEGPPAALFCSTWLLSPTLNDLLPAGSRIKRFSSDYLIYDVNPDSDGFYFWLYDSKRPG